MSPTSSSVVCPLCKKPLGSGVEGAAVSRLCDECRGMVDSLRPARQTPGEVVTDRPAQQVQPQAGAQAPISVQTSLNPNPNSSQNPASDFRQIAEAAGANVPAAPPVFLVPENGQRAPQMPMTAAQAQDNQAWPIVVDAEEKKARSKGWILIVLALLVGVGAAIYAGRNGLFGSLLGSRDSAKPTPTLSAQSKPGHSAVPGTSPSPRSPVAAQTSASPQVSASRQVQPTQSPSAQLVQPTPTPQPQPSQSSPEPGGKFTTFQLASFPNQAGANEFLQRLVRAKIPGYIVSAQIPHRGTWYRVRAGRFANAREQKEASDDWRQRARAAGVEIQLVPCDYEPPLNGK